MGEPGDEAGALDRPGLPDWVKSLGLPPEAADAIDRYWKPVWASLQDELRLLAAHPRRAPAPPPPAGGERIELRVGAGARAGGEVEGAARRAGARTWARASPHVLGERPPAGRVVRARGRISRCSTAPARSPRRTSAPAARPGSARRGRDEPPGARVEWPEYAQAIRTVERERCVLDLLGDPEMTREAFVAAFLEPPLHNTSYLRGFGTVYTAASSRSG